jgi:hypothetical protein
MRIVLTTLRNAKRPLTTPEIAQRVMAERGLDSANVRLLKLIMKRTGRVSGIGSGGAWRARSLGGMGSSFGHWVR